MIWEMAFYLSMAGLLLTFGFFSGRIFQESRDLKLAPTQTVDPYPQVDARVEALIATVELSILPAATGEITAIPAPFTVLPVIVPAVPVIAPGVVEVLAEENAGLRKELKTKTTALKVASTKGKISSARVVRLYEYLTAPRRPSREVLVAASVEVDHREVPVLPASLTKVDA